MSIYKIDTFVIKKKKKCELYYYIFYRYGLHISKQFSILLTINGYLVKVKK